MGQPSKAVNRCPSEAAMRVMSAFFLPCPGDILTAKVKAMFGELRVYFASDVDLNLAAKPFVEALAGFPADCALEALKVAKNRVGVKVQAKDAREEAEHLSAERYAIKAAMEFGTEDAPAKEQPKSREWKPLTQAEYGELSLSGKHRHLLILAGYYRGLAGFMMPKTGKPYNQERWDEYTPLAEQTEAELKRLGDKLTELKAQDREKATGHKSGGLKRPHFDLSFMSQ